MKNSFLIFLILTLTFSSYSQTKKSKVPVETSFNSNSTNGLVIGTITYIYPKKKSPYDKYKFHLTYENENEKEAKGNSTYFTINVNQINGRFNGELNDKKTFPFILEQKPGKYSFDGFYFFWNGGLITREFVNPIKFNLPFIVEQSKITYI